MPSLLKPATRRRSSLGFRLPKLSDFWHSQKFGVVGNLSLRHGELLHEEQQRRNPAGKSGHYRCDRDGGGRFRGAPTTTHGRVTPPEEKPALSRNVTPESDGKQAAIEIERKPMHVLFSPVLANIYYVGGGSTGLLLVIIVVVLLLRRQVRVAQKDESGHHH